MKFRRISTRLLVSIVPILMIALILQTIFSVSNSKRVIDEKTAESMDANLKMAVSEVMENLDSIITTGNVLAETVAAGYKETSLAEYEEILSNLVAGNETALGSGLWFEPYVYDKNEQYVGPYVYKDGNSLVTTYEYSNADYDYFVQDYYTFAKQAGAAIITNPYYDPTSGLIMSSCSVPILDNGTFVGCVTVDMELTNVTGLVEGIKIGETGNAMLLDSNGVYLAGVDSSKIADEENIINESNTSLAAAGNLIMSSQEGKTSYNDGHGTINLYYTTLPQTNWKLAIQISLAELNSSVQSLMALLIIICVIAVLISTVAILFLVKSISRGIMNVQKFAGSLADGDFTIDPIQVRTEDEVGRMSVSLNEMYAGNKEVIQRMSKHAIDISESSKRLRDTSAVLQEQLEEIHDYMSKVNEAMLSTSAATEQVNASTQEVLSNVNLLAGETADNSNMAKEIKDKAAQIKEDCQASSDSTAKMSEQFEKNLQLSIEDAAVVANISELADVISNIAEQINLLSLNASTEAARAGEAGKGFAVVASEIGNLATSTTDAINKIQSTIEQVQKAFSSLTKDAQGMLDFVQNTVTPDYAKFLDVANQYGKDANTFEESSESISEMSNNIRSIMTEVTSAIQNITEATQDTTQTNQNILGAVDQVSDQVENVASMSHAQDSIAFDLDQVVAQFKLE